MTSSGVRHYTILYKEYTEDLTIQIKESEFIMEITLQEFFNQYQNGDIPDGFHLYDSENIHRFSRLDLSDVKQVYADGSIVRKKKYKDL